MPDNASVFVENLGTLNYSKCNGTSVKSVTTLVSQVADANPARQRLSFQNTGLGTITLIFATSGVGAVTGGGIVLDPGAGAGRQGGAWEEPYQQAWLGPVFAIATAASSLTIVEG